jgi:hypothetical protein
VVPVIRSCHCASASMSFALNSSLLWSMPERNVCGSVFHSAGHWTVLGFPSCTHA